MDDIPIRKSLPRSELATGIWQPIDSLPTNIARQWQTADGRARIEVLPKGDPDNPRSLHAFVRAVLPLAPGATGPAVSLYESANTVLHSFIEAGIFAFCVKNSKMKSLHLVFVSFFPVLFPPGQ